MARKNLKIFRQNGHGPEQKGLRSPACGAELPRLGSKGRKLGGDRLTPTPLHSPSGAGED